MITLVWLFILLLALTSLYINASNLQEDIDIFSVSGVIILVLSLIFCLIMIIYYSI